PMKRTYEQVQQADTPDKLVSTLAPDVADVAGAQKKITQNRVNNLIGIPSDINSTIIDSDNDGVVDDPNTIRANFQKQNPKPSLSDGINGLQGYHPSPLGEPAVTSDPIAQSLIAKLSDLTTGSQSIS